MIASFATHAGRQAALDDFLRAALNGAISLDGAATALRRPRIKIEYDQTNSSMKLKESKREKWLHCGVAGASPARRPFPPPTRDDNRATSTANPRTGVCRFFSVESGNSQWCNTGHFVGQPETPARHRRGSSLPSASWPTPDTGRRRCISALNVIVIGSTGLIGSKTVPLQRRNGHRRSDGS